MSRTKSWAVLALALASEWGVYGQTTQATQPSAAVPIAGILLAPDGAPSAESTVWLCWLGASGARTVETRTDREGRFTFSTDEAAELLKLPQLAGGVVVQDTALRLGWCDLGQEPNVAALSVRVRENTEESGRCVDGDGKPVANAEIRLGVVTQIPEGGQPSGLLVSSVPQLADRFKAHSDADGRFTFRNLPRAQRLSGSITAPGFAPLTASWAPGRRQSFTLAKGSRIEGRIKRSDESIPLSGVELYYEGKTPPPPQAGLELFTRTVTTMPAGDGTFAFDNLPPGACTINVRTAPGYVWYAEGVASSYAKPGQTVGSVEIALQKGVLIRGRVVDGKTKRGVAGAAVRVHAMRGADTIMISGPPITTGADGKYVGAVKPGMVMVRIVDLPLDYLPPREIDWKFRLTAEQDSEWPEIELTPATAVSGVVVDETGQPVAGALVDATLPSDQFFEPYAGKHETRTDDAGRFTIHQLDAEDTIPIRARSAEAVTDGRVLIVPNELEQPLRLTLARKHAFRMHGRVVGRTAQPIPDVDVALMWSRNVESSFQEGGRGTKLLTVRTAADGTFETEALWPIDRYRLELGGSNTGKCYSLFIEGEPGKTEDVGTLVLQRANRTVTGRVEDSAGQPVPGVRVINSAESLNRVQTVTDADGRFRLERLLEGAAYVCISKEGYRAGGGRVAPESNEITLKLRRNDAPRGPAATQPSASAPSTQATDDWCATTEVPWDKQARQVRELLEWAWAQPDLHTRRIEPALIAAMAQLDLALAEKWLGEAQGAYDDEVLAIGASHTAGDVEATLKRLEDVHEKLAVQTLRALARRVEASAPEKATRYAEAALARARELPEPARAREMARVGLLLLDLGRRENAESAIREAAEAAMELDLKGEEADARSTAATALAAFDLSAAKDLIKRLTEDPRRRMAEQQLPSGVVRTDPNAAVALLAQIGSSYDRARAAVGVVYQIGLRDPNRAAEVAATISEPGKRAEAYGWLAVAAAPRDRQRAWEFIERGMAVTEDTSTLIPPGPPSGGAAVVAARLAAQARLVGYPDLESLAWRVTALRMGLNQSGDDTGYYQYNLKTYALLALSAPELARRLVADFPPIPENVQIRPVLVGDGVVAQVLADTTLGCRVVRDQIEKAVKGEAYEVEPRYLLQLLTTPPSERHCPENVVFGNLAYWFPDQESWW
jgi:protocatechuate 3,4-dioxygenase beta subunit